MNWDAIGAVGEILAALAVVVSLIYVSIQLRQNTRETKILRTYGLISANSAINSQLADNGELARIVRLGFSDFDGLTDDEKWRCGCFIFSTLNHYDFAYHQYLEGQLEATFWDKISYELPLFIGTPGGRSWWAQDKSRFSPEFVTFLDSKLAQMDEPAKVPTLGIETKESEAQ